MSLILAIEPDRRQAAQLTSVIRRRVGAELILSDTTEQALVAIGKRVPDLVLVQALLSPQDDATLTAALRVIAAAAHVQMLTIPVLAAPSSKGRSRGLFSALRRDKGGDASPDGCDPAVFAEQIASYLERAAEERRVARVNDVGPLAAEEQSPSIVASPSVEVIAKTEEPPAGQVQPAWVLPDRMWPPVEDQAPSLTPEEQTAAVPPEHQAATPLIEETATAVVDEAPESAPEVLVADEVLTRPTNLSAAEEDVAFEQQSEEELESSGDADLGMVPGAATEWPEPGPEPEGLVPESSPEVFVAAAANAPPVAAREAPLLAYLDRPTAHVEAPVAAQAEPLVAAHVEPPVAAHVEPTVPAYVEPSVAAHFEPPVAAHPEPEVAAHVEVVEEQQQAILIPAAVEAVATTDSPSSSDEQAFLIFTDAMLAPVADQAPTPSIDKPASTVADEAPASASDEPVQDDTATPFIDLTATLEEIALKPVPIDPEFVAEFNQGKPFELTVEDEGAEHADQLEHSDQTDFDLWMPLGTWATWPKLQGGLAEPSPEGRVAAARQTPPITVHPEIVVSPEKPSQTLAAAAPGPEPEGVIPPGSEKPSAEPDWVELIEALRRDVERLRAERWQAPPVVSAEPAETPASQPVPPARHRNEPATVKPKRRSKKPEIQDEWGFFDPEQCGFSALLAKLDEVTARRDDPPNEKSS